MSAFFTLRNALIALVVSLAVALGFETDWSSALTAPTVSLHPVNPRQDAAGVLPDFKLSGDSSAYGQIAEHPLLSPTRKPAPTQAVALAPESPKPLIRRDLYQLIGVADLGDTRIGQVREIATGRVQSVRQGQSLQEMLVKNVDPGSVTLAFASESDILELPKYTASGRVPQPAPPPAPVAAAMPPPQPTPAAMSASPRMRTTPTPTPTAIPSQATDNGGAAATVSAQVASIIERRRLAREQQGQQTPLTTSGAPSALGPSRPQQ